jgi:integrase
MAWLYRYKDSSRWFIGWRSAGKIRARSTGKTSKKDAEKELAAFVAMQAIHERGGPLDELYRSLSAATRPEAHVRALKAELDDWIDEAEKTTRPGTADRYRVIAKDMIQFFGADDEKPRLDAVNSDAVRAYLADVLKRKSASTANMERKCLRVFFRRAIANGRLTHDPAAPIKPFKADADATHRRPFTVAEVNLLLSKAEGFWRYAILCGFYTGLRMSDIASMPVGAVDLHESVIRLAAIKTGSRVTIPIPEILAEEIRKRIGAMKKPKPTDPLWPEEAGMRSGARSNQFRELLVLCGLVEARTHKKTKDGRDTGREASTVSFHCLRHTFVSLLKATGSGQAVAKALAGHASDDISDHYTTLPIETLRSAVRALPDLEAKR